MFARLAEVESAVRVSSSTRRSSGDIVAERRKLGLADYVYQPAHIHSRSGYYPISGAPVQISCNKDRLEYYRELTARPAHRSAECSLCREIPTQIPCSLGNFEGVLMRNRNPYGDRHGLFKSPEEKPPAAHLERETWNQTPQLEALLRLAYGLGATRRSRFESWQSGAFGTQAHFHFQFRLERSSIWQYLIQSVPKLSPMTEQESPVLLARLGSYPTAPLYMEGHQLQGLAIQMSRCIRDTVASGARSGVMACYEQKRWKILIVTGLPLRRFGHPVGILERLGEWSVIEEHDLDCDLAGLEQALRETRAPLSVPGNEPDDTSESSQTPESSEKK